MQEMDKYMDSMEYKSIRLRNAMVGFWQIALDTETMKNFVDLGYGVVKAMTGIIDKVGIATPTMVLFSTAIFALNTNMRTAIMSAQGLVGQGSALTAVFAQGTVAANIFSVAIKGVTTALTFLGKIFIPLAIIAGITYGFTRLINTIQDYHREQSQLKQEFEKLNQTFLDHRNEIDNLINKYEELSKISDAPDQALDIEQLEEYSEVQNRLAELLPILVEEIDEQGNARLRHINAIQKEIEYLKQVSDIKRDEMLLTAEKELLDTTKEMNDLLDKKIEKEQQLGKLQDLGEMHERIALQGKLGQELRENIEKYGSTSEEILKLRLEILELELQAERTGEAFRSHFINLITASFEKAGLAIDENLTKILEEIVRNTKITAEEAMYAIDNLIVMFDEFGTKVDQSAYSTHKLEAELTNMYTIMQGLGLVSNLTLDDFIKKATEASGSTEELNSLMENLGVTNERLKSLFEDLGVAGDKALDDFVESVIKSSEEANSLEAYIIDLYESLEELGLVSDIALDDFIDMMKEAAGVTKDTDDAVENLITTLDQAQERFSEMGSRIKDLTKFKEELAESGKLSAESLDLLISKYPELIHVLNEHVDGIAMIDEAVEESTKFQQAALDFIADYHAETLRIKLENDEQFFNEKIRGEEQLWNIVANAYGQDAENFRTIADVKARIDTELRMKLAKGWNTFYGTWIAQGRSMMSFLYGAQEAMRWISPEHATYGRWSELAQLGNLLTRIEAPVATAISLSGVSVPSLGVSIGGTGGRAPSGRTGTGRTGTGRTGTGSTGTGRTGTATRDDSEALKEYTSRLEKFYNELRKISQIEAEINQILAERQLLTDPQEIIASIQREVQLRTQLRSLYKDLLELQRRSLRELATKIRSRFGRVVTISDDLKELNINMERYNSLSDEQKEELDDMIAGFDELTQAVNQTNQSLAESGRAIQEYLEQMTKIEQIEQSLNRLRKERELLRDEREILESLRKEAIILGDLKNIHLDTLNIQTKARDQILKQLKEYSHVLSIVGDQVRIKTNAWSRLDEATQNMLSSAIAGFNYLTQIINEAEDAVLDLTISISRALDEIIERRQRVIEQEERERERLEADYQRALDTYEREKERAADELIRVVQDSIRKRLRAFEVYKREELRIARESHQEQMKMLDDELRKYEEIINAKLREIDRTESEEDFQKRLAKLQEERAETLRQINLLAMDDSIEARAKLSELHKKLAQQDEEIEELKHKRTIELRKQNLQDDLEAKREEVQTKKDAEAEQFAIFEQRINDEVQKEQWRVNELLNNERYWAERREEIMQGNLETISQLFEENMSDINYYIQNTADLLAVSFEEAARRVGISLERIKNIWDGFTDIQIPITTPPPTPPPELQPKTKVYGTPTDLEIAKKYLDPATHEFIDITKMTPEQISQIGEGDIVVGGRAAIGDLAAQYAPEAIWLHGATRYDTEAAIRQYAGEPLKHRVFGNRIDLTLAAEAGLFDTGLFERALVTEDNMADMIRRIGYGDIVLGGPAVWPSNIDRIIAQAGARWVWGRDRDETLAKLRDVANLLPYYHKGGIVGKNVSNRILELINDLFNTRRNETVVRAKVGELMIPQENIFRNFIPNMQGLFKDIQPQVIAGGDTYSFSFEIENLRGTREDAEMFANEVFKITVDNLRREGK